jgi:hypothetical protein
MMQSLLAKEAGTYRPTYLLIIIFITVLLGTYPENCTDLPGPNASVCLCLGTYLGNLTDLPSPKFQRHSVCLFHCVGT